MCLDVRFGNIGYFCLDVRARSDVRFGNRVRLDFRFGSILCVWMFGSEIYSMFSIFGSEIQSAFGHSVRQYSAYLDVGAENRACVWIFGSEVLRAFGYSVRKHGGRWDIRFANINCVWVFDSEI